MESLRAVCDYAFTTGGLRRLTACVTEGNQASRRLLEKTGFVLEGTLRESYWLEQRWQNDWLFGLLKRDYFATSISGHEIKSDSLMAETTAWPPAYGFSRRGGDKAFQDAL